jgi:hypothetical protein
MADVNIFQQQVVPVKPRVLAQERVFVYVPTATTNQKGIASFETRDFRVNAGQVQLTWPMSQLVETLADPIAQPSLTKVLPDEFVHTGNTSSLRNSITGQVYTSSTAEIKLRRDNLDATLRPELVMLSSNDFEATKVGNYNSYHLKAKDPTTGPASVWLDDQDFKYDGQVTHITWPYANKPETTAGNTNGYGLVKIAPNSTGLLTYDSNGNLAVDNVALISRNSDNLSTRPTYGANASTGFTDYANYVNANGLATKNASGNTLLKITKDAVGLSNVANRAFGDYRYSDFGPNMQVDLTSRFSDREEWDDMFADWAPPSEDKSTPQKWLTELDEEDIALWDSLRSLNLFLGYFDNLNHLESLHPASNITYGHSAFLLSTNSYWAIEPDTDYLVNDPGMIQEFLDTHTLTIGQTVGILSTNRALTWNGSQLVDTRDINFSWYDTTQQNLSFMDYVETDAAALQPDGVASVGQSGKWIQSDHIHPRDTTKLDADTTITITSNFNNNSSTDFYVALADPTTPDRMLNLPYVRKAQRIHNMRDNPSGFVDSVASEEAYWAGSALDFSSLDTSVLPNGTTFIVDDGEGIEPGDFVTKEQLSRSGVDIETLSETIVTADGATMYDGTWPVTLTSWTNVDGEPRIDASALNYAGVNGTLVVTDGSGKLVSKPFIAQTIIGMTDAGIPVSVLRTGNIVKTSTSLSGNVTGATGALAVFGTGNTVSGFNAYPEQVPIVGTSTGAVAMRSEGTVNRIVYEGPSGSLTSTDGFNYANVLRSSSSDLSSYLTSGRLLQSGSSNQVMTFNSGTVTNRPLVSNGINGVTTLTSLTASRMVMTDASGGLTTLVMSAATAGQVVGVTSTGTPGLLSITTPTTLPVTTQTTNPSTNNANGYILVRLTSDPGTYRTGVLYLW